MKIADSFDEHYLIDPVSGCWNWQRGTNGVGYGKFYLSGKRSDGTIREVLAHRFSYERVHGPIPDGLHICHTCDNPKCVNPAHLFAGTNQENMRDCLRKGRIGYRPHPREQNGRAKLTEDQVLRIRRAFRAGATKASLARTFHVCERQIKRITDGQQWPEQAGSHA